MLSVRDDDVNLTQVKICGTSVSVHKILSDYLSAFLKVTQV